MDILAAVSLSTPWADEAACADVPDDFEFVGTRHEEQQPEWVTERLEYCERCPVRLECLTFALETSSEGVWGGSTSTERRALLPDAHRTAEGDGWTISLRRRRAQEVAEELEAGFPQRLESWRTRPKPRHEVRTCSCGRNFKTTVDADRCKPCRTAERREVIRAYWRAHPALQRWEVARNLNVSEATVSTAGSPPPFTRKCSRCRKEYPARRGPHGADTCRECRTTKPRKSAPRPCAVCGKEFTSTSSRRKLCGSPSCKRENQRRSAARRYKHKPPRALECPMCGTRFEAVHSQTKFCSPECSGKARRERQKAPAPSEDEAGAVENA